MSGGISGGSLARRYARALIETAQEVNQVESFGLHLETLAHVFENDWHLLHAVGTDSHPEIERKAAISEVADRLGCHPHFKNFLLILVHKLRMLLLPEIAREYQELQDEVLGIVRVKVISPKAPEPAMLNRIQELLEKRLQKKVVCHGRAQPEILGGLILEVSHMVYDGSVARELERIKERMLAA